METVGADGKVTATLNNDATKAALQRLKAMRWDDNSHGLHLRLRLGHDQPGVRRRPGRHVHRRLRPLHRDGPEQRPQARRLRRHDHPARERPNAGVLGGGTLAAVNVVTTEAERDAAVNWIDFYYMQKLLTQEGAVADAKALKANNQPVGVPALPIFDKATYDAVPGLDQGLHQRPHGADDAVHVEDLRPAARHRADRPHPGALRGPRPRRAGRAHRQERRHRRAARCGQRPGPGHPRRG